jgi:hypothetical protein
MSGFQDTFGRNNQEKELQYDDAASYFFFASILSLIFFPLMIHVYLHWSKKPNFDEKKIKCRWREEFNKEEFRKRQITRFFYFKATLLFNLRSF